MTQPRDPQNAARTHPSGAESAVVADENDRVTDFVRKRQEVVQGKQDQALGGQ